jgi:hypothetical protein
MVNIIEGLLQTLYNYFSKSFKSHLEFSKLVKFMEMKGPKILKDVKNLLDIYVVPYLACDGGVQNFVVENGP